MADPGRRGRDKSLCREMRECMQCTALHGKLVMIDWDFGGINKRSSAIHTHIAVFSFRLRHI